MRRLTFRERDTADIGPNGELNELEAEGIALLSDRLPPGALAWGHRTLRFGPFCGIIRTRQLTAEILPKIDYGPQNTEAMRGVLVALLARAGELAPKRVGNTDLGHQRAHLLDIFIEDFCYQVATALKGGVIARYTERTENLGAVRGRIELTEHLQINAFDRSRLLCRFDERSIDNLYNQSLKSVLRILLRQALNPSTRAKVATFLHRFDEVGDRHITVHEMDALRFDRTNKHWEPVFRRASSLLAGLFPDVRIGETPGSALLFNMEKLFETVLGLRIRYACQSLGKGRLSVALQGPLTNLARSNFGLRPDITILNGNNVAAILDAKWKLLDISERNYGVSSEDAYQMNAYASRNRCNRLALIYPASFDCPPGRVTEFVLMTEEQPVLEVIAVDVRKLAFGSEIPDGVERIISHHSKQRSSAAEYFINQSTR